MLSFDHGIALEGGHNVTRYQIPGSKIRLHRLLENRIFSVEQVTNIKKVKSK